MHLRTVFRVLGILLMLFSFSMLPPIVVDKVYHEHYFAVFSSSFSVTFLAGFILWLLCRHANEELKIRDGFLIVILFWTVLSFFGSLPLMLSTTPHLSFTDALFESVSGFTTTGATILNQKLESLPFSIRYYRQQLEFLGGMGIVVLAVAVLPMLGVGGMQLYRAETPGPMKDSKLTPRITQTAKFLWTIYLGLTVLCTLSYWLAGLSPFDALGEAFATISTGGFSLHAKSFLFYHSPTAECLAVFFMFLGATNFSLHFLALNQKRLNPYWEDAEFRSFCLITLSLVAVITLTLLLTHTYAQTNIAFINSLFDTISLLTTTGYVAANYSTWPLFLPTLLTFCGIIGGCAASTSGGIKVIRFLLLHKQTQREIKRLLHPSLVAPIKFGKQQLPEPIIEGMWGFIAAFLGLFVVLFLALQATGLDSFSAFGALAACQSNAGAAIGLSPEGFAAINPSAKWILIIAMLAGRLEVFTLLALLTPTFWRR